MLALNLTLTPRPFLHQGDTKKIIHLSPPFHPIHPFYRTVQDAQPKVDNYI